MKKIITGFLIVILVTMLVRCGTENQHNVLHDVPVSTDKITFSVNHTTYDFVLSLFTDREVYNTTDVIQIWATLEYIGTYDTITIWHGTSPIAFNITDGNNFNIDCFSGDVLLSTDIQQGEVYRFDYKKSGGFDADAPNADFWRNFFSEENLFLPVGRYTITAFGAFSLSEKMLDSPLRLKSTLNINIVE